MAGKRQQCFNVVSCKNCNQFIFILINCYINYVVVQALVELSRLTLKLFFFFQVIS